MNTQKEKAALISLIIIAADGKCCSRQLINRVTNERWCEKIKFGGSLGVFHVKMVDILRATQ